MSENEQAQNASAGQEPVQEQGSQPIEQVIDQGQQGEQLSHEDALAALAATRREAAKYRTELRSIKDEQAKAIEAKRQADLSAEERAKEAEAKAAEAVRQAEERVAAAERKASLSKLVTNPDRVIRLMDDPAKYFSDDGKPNVDAITKDFPEYIPRPAAGTAQHDNRPMGRVSASIDEQIRRSIRS